MINSIEDDDLTTALIGGSESIEDEKSIWCLLLLRHSRHRLIGGENQLRFLYFSVTCLILSLSIKIVSHVRCDCGVGDGRTGSWGDMTTPHRGEEEELIRKQQQLPLLLIRLCSLTGEKKKLP